MDSAPEGKETGSIYSSYSLIPDKPITTSRKAKKFIITTVLFIVSFSCIALWFVENIRRMLLTETETHLIEMTARGLQSVHDKVQNDLSILQGLAIYISSNKKADSSDIWQLLQINVQSGNFLRIGIIDSAGNAHTTDNQMFYAGDRDYFGRSMLGESVVSETLIDIVSGGTINVYSVPLYTGSTITGMLFATYSSSTIMNILSVPFFNGRGFSLITNRTGDIVFFSDNGQNRMNLFDSLAACPPSAVQALRDAFNVSQTGVMRFKADNMDNYIVYVPVEEINDWYFVSIIPTEVVSERATAISLLSVNAAALCIVFFACILIYIEFSKRKQEKLIYALAFQDQVTGGGNINKFIIDARLVLQKNTDMQYSLISLDIDKFKIINALYGYKIGDRILKRVHSVIGENIRADQMYARVSSDLFVILTSFDGTESSIIDLLERIEKKLTKITIPGYPVITLVFSSGIYLIPQHNPDINGMLDKANMARETVKGKHNPSYRFFDDAIRNRLIDEKSIENDMENALKNGEFCVFYQPKIELATGNLSGAEALVRWIHPVKGIISPDQFIPIFEKNGFILQIDRYVLRSVCARMNQWMKKNISVFPVSVNLSRTELNQPDIIDYISRTIREFEIVPELIEIELTESIAYENIDFLVDIMTRLKSIGVKISIDDFGAGYSSLSLLERLPIDVLKLDKEFLKDVETSRRSKHIVKSVVQLAKSLGIQVVSEGVETEEQARFLREIECDLAQGYIFAKPLSLERFEKILFEGHIFQNTSGIN